MPREHNRLTVRKISKPLARGLHSDGDGLYLQVSKWGTKSWVLRYMLKGRARTMGLGSCRDISLKQARERAGRARELLTDPIRRVDPIDARNAAELAHAAEAAKVVTFKEAAERYIKAHSIKWRSPKHLAQWRSTLEAYAHPKIGNLSVAAVDTNLVMEILDPIWAEKTETAMRLRGRIEMVLGYATARGLRRGDNPARWKGLLVNLLAERSKIAKVEHLAAMHYREVPAFVAQLRATHLIAARALEFAILTAARTGEVTGARWSEIDFISKVWVVPAGRMKAGNEHRVALSDRAVELLMSVPREIGSDFVFPSAKAGRPLAINAMRKLLHSMRGTGVTVHGFRSSFKDFASEQTNISRDVAEAALAHALTGETDTEKAYRRSDLLEKRRRLMEAWAGSVGRHMVRDNVTPMQRKGA